MHICMVACKSDRCAILEIPIDNVAYRLHSYSDQWLEFFHTGPEFNSLIMYRVVAKKIVSRLRFSFNRLPFFARVQKWILSPIFATPWMQGYQTSCLQDGGCSTWKENTLNYVLNTRFYSNYLTCHTGNDTQGSREFIHNFSFTCRQFDMVQISYDCTCVT